MVVFNPLYDHIYNTLLYINILDNNNQYNNTNISIVINSLPRITLLPDKTKKQKQKQKQKKQSEH